MKKRTVVMVYELKTKVYYEINKKKFNVSKNMDITKKYRGPKYVGFCTELHRTIKPESYQAFLYAYLKSSEENNFDPETLTGDEHKGRSLEQLYMIAERFCNELNNENITLEECLDDLINHVIIETYDGIVLEDYVINMINKTKEYVARPVTGEFDRNFNVDIIVEDMSGRLRRFLQIKPLSTFKSDNNLSLIVDRRKFFKKEKDLKEYLKKKGMPDVTVDYIIYDKSEYEKNGNILFFKRNNGKYGFKLNELINNDGKMKFSILDKENGTFERLEI